MSLNKPLICFCPVFVIVKSSEHISLFVCQGKCSHRLSPPPLQHDCSQARGQGLGAFSFLLDRNVYVGGEMAPWLSTDLAEVTSLVPEPM